MPFARSFAARFRAGAILVAVAVTAGGGFVIAQQANGPLFYDQRRLPDMEVERRNQEVLGEQRRIAEEKRRDAEALARKQAEDARQAQEEKRMSLEADTKRKADEEKRVAAEVESKRKADEEKRVAAEAESKRKADDEKRVAAEAESKRKADEEMRIAATAEAAKQQAAEAAKVQAAEAAKSQAAAAPKPQVAALVPAVVAPAVVAPPTAVAPAGTCEPAKVSAKALPGGLAQIIIESPCRRSQTVAVHYGAFDLARKFGASGQASFALDLFLGPKASLQLGFADGSTQPVQLPDQDLSTVSKIALIWQAPVDLDLHAIESGGAFGKAGHRWQGAASSLDATNAEVAATGHGAGYISTTDDGTHDGSRIEVYTFVHSPEQDSGAVTMLIDYASRGATPSGDKCGTGALAEIPFDVVVLDHKGKIRTESSLIPAQPCGVPLTQPVRYLRGAVPDLRFRN